MSNQHYHMSYVVSDLCFQMFSSGHNVKVVEVRWSYKCVMSVVTPVMRVLPVQVVSSLAT